MKLRKILDAVKFLNGAAIALSLSQKGSLKKFLGECRLNYYTHKQLGLPEIGFYKFFPKCQESAESIRILSEEKTGGLSALELQYISSIMKCYPIESVFEIGTFDGCAAAHMILNAKNPDTCRVVTLDLSADDFPDFAYDPSNHLFLEQRRPGYYLRKYIKKGVTRLHGDSQKFNFEPYYNMMDLIFIDGNHNLPYIQNDTENALKMLKIGGILLWHDYFGIPGEDISDYLNQLLKNLPIYRIAKTTFAVYRKNE